MSCGGSADRARGDGSELRILIVRPPRPTGGTSTSQELIPLVLWMHGGAFTIGSEKDAAGTPLWNALRSKYKARAVFASVAYRVAPEHRAPACADDAELAAHHLLSSSALAERHGYDNTTIHVWGPSAGASAALVLAAAFCRRGERHLVASVLADCPMGNPTCDTASFTRNSAAAWLAPAKWIKWAWGAYLGTPTAEGRRAALRDPRVCPHTAPGGLEGVAGLPVVLTTAKADVLHDEGVAMAQAWRQAGADVLHVDCAASHCMGWTFDTKSSRAASERLAALLLKAGA